jgi:hypothetical protein
VQQLYKIGRLGECPEVIRCDDQDADTPDEGVRPDGVGAIAVLLMAGDPFGRREDSQRAAPVHHDVDEVSEGRAVDGYRPILAFDEKVLRLWTVT